MSGMRPVLGEVAQITGKSLRCWTCEGESCGLRENAVFSDNRTRLDGLDV